MCKGLTVKEGARMKNLLSMAVLMVGLACLVMSGAAVSYAQEGKNMAKAMSSG